MYNPDTDLIFPPRMISTLSNERSSVWKDLVARTQNSDSDSPEKVAFILMMARLNNCASCNADSYRAIQGCYTCARQALKRFHGTDEELVRLFDVARSEIILYINKKTASH